MWFFCGWSSKECLTVSKPWMNQSFRSLGIPVYWEIHVKKKNYAELYEWKMLVFLSISFISGTSSDFLKRLQKFEKKESPFWFGVNWVKIIPTEISSILCGLLGTPELYSKIPSLSLVAPVHNKANVSLGFHTYPISCI